jgi:hypothetical protein
MKKVVGLAVLGIAFYFLGMIVMIQWRLTVNGGISKEMVKALRERFPDVRVMGGASYEKEVIYVTVTENQENSEREKIRDWLANHKEERRIGVSILLRFASGNAIESTDFELCLVGR